MIWQNDFTYLSLLSSRIHAGSGLTGFGSGVFISQINIPAGVP